MLAEAIKREARYFSEELKSLYAHAALGPIIRAATNTEGHPSRQILSALREMFSDTSWISDAGRRWVDHLQNDAFHVPPVPGALADGGSDVVKTALVFKNDALILSLQSFDSQALSVTRERLAVANYVILTGRTTVTRVVNGGSLFCELVEFGPLDVDFDLDEPLEVRGARPVILDSNSPPLVTDGRTTATRYLNSVGNPLLLSATIFADALPFRCSVDTRTGAILSVNATRDVDNMVRSLMTVLRQLDDSERDTLLRKYFAHPAHFVRWHALREFAAMQGAEAIPTLLDVLSGEASAYVRRAIESLIRALEDWGRQDQSDKETACL